LYVLSCQTLLNPSKSNKLTLYQWVNSNDVQLCHHRLFYFADKDEDQKLFEAEVRGLIIGLGLQDSLTLHGIEIDNVVDKWMSEFDIVEADTTFI
jgi:hypothetical protein